MHPYVEQLQHQAPEFHRAVTELGSVVDLLGRLAQTPQDPMWHGEGDVAAHVVLVIGALERELETTDVSLDSGARQVLRLAALLHDVAKPLVTRTELVQGRSRIVSPNHARRAAGYLALRLPDLGLVDRTYLEVLQLIRHHHDVRECGPPHRLWHLARQARLPLLFLLGLADARGRRTDDEEQLEQRVQLFRMACEEYGAWDGAGALHRELVQRIADGLGETSTHRLERMVIDAIRDLEQGRIRDVHQALARVHRRTEHGARLIVTCGVSGSGKSQWIARHLPHHARINLDHLRQELTGRMDDQRRNQQVIKLARDRLRQHLRRGDALVWDATSLLRRHRQGVLQTAEDYGAHTTLVVFCPALSTILARNTGRRNPVPLQTVQRQLASLQWPGDDEAHRTLHVNGAGQVFHDSRDWWQQILRS